jgi:acetyl-CoA C-acetyltransferase
MTACIVGWSHTPFGKHENDDVESLIGRVAVQALEDAGIGPDEVDEIVVGHFNEGFSRQAFPSSLVLQFDDRLRFKPATRVENACATGSAAVYQGLRAIAAKAARFVLVVGVEQMTDHLRRRDRQYPAEGFLPEGGRRNRGRVRRCLRAHRAAVLPAHGDQSDALAMIAAKNHRNGVGNPLRRCARISATNSAATRNRRRIRSWRGR